MVFTVRKSKIVESVLQDIWKGLSELDKSEVYSSLDSRIDATGSLFLRIDKQEALKGKIRLQNTDPIKVEFSFRTKFSKAAEFVEDIRRSLDAI